PAGPIQVVDGNAILDVDFGFCYSGQRGNRQLQFNSFNFQSDTNGVWLNWSTFAGTENLGFDVFRSLSQMGNFTLINPDVIPAANNQNGFNNYSFFDPDVEPGQTYYYKISDVTIDGEATATYGPVAVTAGTTRIAEETSALRAPVGYELGNAYPNPFNGQTAIQYSLARPADVSIAIYNLQGQKIRTLLSERQTAGNHTVHWNGHDELNQPVGSGVYLYRITINNSSEAKRVVYLK
ncbi:MAG: T9SS type A sorting domain-containing protein, partial [candidate division KSB1 bacterium]|nr:T9SS type A sorting domain-containing protein [candidate division KSB1 bacterium]